jgi:hypothetical protein
MKAQPTIIPEIVSQLGENSAPLWRDCENAVQPHTYPSVSADLETEHVETLAFAAPVLGRRRARRVVKRMAADLSAGRRSG